MTIYVDKLLLSYIIFKKMLINILYFFKLHSLLGIFLKCGVCVQQTILAHMHPMILYIQECGINANFLTN